MVLKVDGLNHPPSWLEGDRMAANDSETLLISTLRMKPSARWWAVSQPSRGVIVVMAVRPAVTQAHFRTFCPHDVGMGREQER